MIVRSSRGLASRMGPLFVMLALAAANEGCRCSSRLKGLSGEGAVDPTSIDFGTLTLGQSVSKKLTVRNVGTVPLDIESVTFSGANVMDFALAQPIVGKSVGQGQSLSVMVTFTPLFAGARAATLQIGTDSRLTPQLTVTLTGNGVDIQICAQPASLDFGNVQVLGTPVTQTVTLTNCGQSPTDVAVQPMTGPQASDFALTGAVSTATLQPGDTFLLNVAYSPMAIGPSIAMLPYLPCAQCMPAMINLSGVGVDAALSFMPSPASFGNVGVGMTPTLPVTVTNSGTEAMTLTGVQVRGSPSPFAILNPPGLPAQLMPGQSIAVTVQFTAPATGSTADFLDGTFGVADLAVPTRVASDQLSANGQTSPCTIQVTPSPVAFGNVTPMTMASKSASISNVGGQTCNVTGIALGAASDPYFALANPAQNTLTLMPGQSQPVGLTFHPTAATPPALRTGTLTFQSNDPNHASVSVPLNGYINNSIYSGGWPKWHYDNFNTGQTLADTSWLQGTIGWSFNVGASSFQGFLESPVVDAAGVVYFESMADSCSGGLACGMLYAVNPTGTQLWVKQLSDPSSDPHPSTPVILASGSLYVVSGQEQASDPNLYLLQASDGTVKYSTTFGIEGFSATPGFANDGTLFEADDDGVPGNGAPDDPSDAIAFKVQANGSISQIAGHTIPFTWTSSPERLSVVIDRDDSSYWCCQGECSALAAPSAGFGLKSGWPSTPLTFANPPTTASDVVSDVAMDPNPGGLLYAYGAWEDFDLSGNTLIGGVLVAMNPSNGSIKWTLNLPETAINPLSSPTYGNGSPAVASDGTVYVGNSDGLRAVNGLTGVVKWHFSSGNVTGAPAIGNDGTVFFGTADGNLFAVHPTGALRFKVAAPGGKQIGAAPAIASDGTVYFVSDNGMLYAVK